MDRERDHSGGHFLYQSNILAQKLKLRIIVITLLIRIVHRKCTKFKENSRINDLKKKHILPDVGGCADGFDGHTFANQ